MTVPKRQIQTLMLRTFMAALLVLGMLINPAFALESIFGSGPSPLPVEEAFKISVDDSNPDEVRVNLSIADGYYLYQKKFSFEANDNAVTLREPRFPEALVHEDDYFGKSNVYRNDASIGLPVSHAGTAEHFNMTVGFQGCADMGLCYPPTKTDFKVRLPAQTIAASSTANLQVAQADPVATPKASKIDIKDLLENKPSFNNDNDAEPLLHPSEAFVPSVTKASNGQISVQWFIQPGYYLYRDKIQAQIKDAGNASIASIEIDRGNMQTDAFFGDVEVLREVPGARIELDNASGLQKVNLEVFYQGCADIGVCFPPESRVLPVLFADTGNNSESNTVAMVGDAGSGTDGGGATQSAQSNAVVSNVANSAVQSASQNTLPVTEQDRLTRLLEAGNLGLIALAFYGAGLLLAFTACVYPMIPILSSLIVGHGEKISTAKAFSLSAVYVMSMASVFAVLGILVGLSGYNIQPLFQNPWVLTAFAALFVVLALSMFGLFQLQMPSALQAKVTEISNKQSGGTYTGVAVMGVLSALIVGPCVTPPLVAALAYIAKTGDATIGGIALFAIGIGMGTPLLLIGTSLGKWMPKAGGWMDTTQRIFGVILIGVAIYMLSRFLPASLIMMMYAVLAIFTGVYFGATDRLDSDSRGSQRLGKSFGLVAVIYGVVLMVGALAGNTSMLSPLRGVVGQQTAQNSAGGNEQHVSFQRIKSEADLSNVLAQAKSQGRPVMLDFYADWCVSCKEMEAFTFPDSRVREQLSDAILIQADVTKNDADDKALLKKFGLFGPPGIILYDRAGVELTAGRVVGYMPAAKFSEHLKAYLNQSGV